MENLDSEFYNAEMPANTKKKKSKKKASSVKKKEIKRKTN